MIGRLKGRLEVLGDGSTIVDVGGVGYLVQMSARCREELGGDGAVAEVLVETVVREDAIRLFGFANASEKGWFTLLQNVQGVGAKVALAILDVLPVEDLSDAIADGDQAQVGRAQGVGPKLAKRIVSELKDKAPPGLVVSDLRKAASDLQKAAPRSGRVARADAVSALVNLGYALPQATEAIEKASELLGPEADIQEMIREGLKSLAVS